MLAKTGMIPIDHGSGFILPLGISALWLLLCLGLSQFFGRRITRPVKELSRWAKMRGTKIPAPILRRHDELGLLAGSLEAMQGEIKREHEDLQDRARILEAMQRINLAVREGPSRADLLDRILETILDYVGAHMAAIAVRDPDGGGFDVIASRGTHSTTTVRPPTVGGFVPDELLPDSFLVRLFDPFEIPYSRFKPEVRQQLSGDFAGNDSNCMFANLPFEAPGYFSGSLLLLRQSGGPVLSQIQFLADQAGAALRDLALRVDSERNWQAVAHSLVRAVDAKSKWTCGHSQRVANLAVAVGQRLLMDKREIERLGIAALLHDVGKIGVPESILDKVGKLEPAEFELIRQHPAIGAEIVVDVPSYGEMRSAILYHHERWDGTGYPEGLAEENIPLTARIIALADVWDAITNERPYRKAMNVDEARIFMAEGAGKSFDARMVRIFLDVLAEGGKRAHISGDDQARLVTGMTTLSSCHRNGASRR
ncbi:MAG: HD domain-containing phosphohydrolase [Rectinemataceae bacterium]